MSAPFIIIDTNNLLCRAFFAVPAMATPDGEPSNAVFGLLKMVRALVRDWSPTHIAACIDHPSKNWRHSLYPEYKANRKANSDAFDDLRPQFARAQEGLVAMNIKTVRIEGQEADDSIATLVEEAIFAGHPDVLVVTSDKDLLQLVRDEVPEQGIGRVRVLDTMANKVYTPVDVFNKLGVYPARVREYLALVGDASDNVPGCKGVGPKTAIKLLAENETLDRVLQAPDTVKGKLRERIIQHKSTIELSYVLVGLNDMVVIPPTSDFLIQDITHRVFMEFCTEMGFKSLLRE